jgi:hypothetical protein
MRVCNWAEIREYFGDLAGGVCEEEGCSVRERLQPHHDHTLVADLAGFRAYYFYGQEVNLHRIYGRRVIRMLCPPHHHDKHPEHHDEDYRRTLRAELEEFETWLAELQERKDKSKSRLGNAPSVS